MKTRTMASLLAGVLASTHAGLGIAFELSEQDYFAELPTVLTVSRLAQPIAETPGAVTVIDRETIRRSGARELVDVLRLVPGYLIGGYNGANPSASYHAPIDDYGIRNLVLIDGRPVYSAYYFGGTSRGMMGVLLEDIERIEVLRGSNSAAYGANAMFGVINIITRNAEDSHGVGISLTQGGGETRDNYARLGWGDEKASYRLSIGRRSDDGYGGVRDRKIIRQAHFRGDLRPAADQELMLSGAVVELSSGEGFPHEIGNLERTAGWRNVSLQIQWARQLAESEEIKLSASFDEERIQDSFGYVADPSVIIGSSGRGRRINLELQHQLEMRPALRAVWGAGYKYDDAVSPALYYTGEAVSIREERLFGNIEWRAHPRLLVNAGGFAGFHNWTGNYFSPRLMANFLATPDHAFRAGMTESSRTPNLFELAGDVRFTPKNALNTPLTHPLPDSPKAVDYMPYLAAMGQSLRKYAASGTVRPERLFSQEIGYFGNFRALRLTLDVRAYLEKTRQLVYANPNRIIPGYLSGEIPAGTPTTRGPLPVALPLAVPLKVTDFENVPGFVARGLEYQLRWKPVDSTEIWVNQAFQRTRWDGNVDQAVAPTHATMIVWFQKLSDDLDFTAMYQALGAMTWNKAEDALPRRRLLDLRLAKRFMIGASRAEAALAVRAANGSQPEYQTGTGYTLERRAYGTLRIAF